MQKLLLKVDAWLHLEIKKTRLQVSYRGYCIELFLTLVIDI
jgi:hypothetical protein